MRRNLVLLGSTGSIGRQTLDVAERFPDRVRVLGLAAGRNTDLLVRQARRHLPAIVSSDTELDITRLGDGIEVLMGEQGMIDMVSRPEVDLVVVGTSGRAGLLPTLAALESGKLVALANKEALVAAGGIIRERVEAGVGSLVPIDSEHSAVWQCLQGEPSRSIERLTLTASGGALRLLSVCELSGVTPEQAMRHPTWQMGSKITIDSANLMNKGLEVLEAGWLFDIGMDRIDVVLHAQSIVHSLVTFDDSSTKAQLGLPDMRLPIQYALSHPERWANDLPRLDLPLTSELTFAPIDLNRYPALRIALDAGRQGGTYPAALCAADEIAVEAFMQRRIPFTSIPDVVEQTLDTHTSCGSPKLDDILEADLWARRAASGFVAHL